MKKAIYILILILAILAACSENQVVMALHPNVAIVRINVATSVAPYMTDDFRSLGRIFPGEGVCFQEETTVWHGVTYQQAFFCDCGGVVVRTTDPIWVRQSLIETRFIEIDKDCSE